MQTIEDRETRLRPTPYRHVRLRAIKLSVVALLAVAGIIWGISAATKAGADRLEVAAETTVISVEALRGPLTASVSLPSTKYEKLVVDSPEALRDALSDSYYDRSSVNDVLVDEYAWMERSEGVEALQERLGVETDGVYGLETRTAHAAELAAFGLHHPPLPEVVIYTPPVRDSLPPRLRDDVPAPVLERIQSLWPEDQWARAVSVAFCESRFQVDAANPTSSARGVFQLLAPWRRDPGTGRTVWGWEYTDSGEKLSAAAGLGISEADATYTLANITVAHLIWQNSGWGPWAASQHCWAE